MMKIRAIILIIISLLSFVPYNLNDTKTRLIKEEIRNGS